MVVSTFVKAGSRTSSMPAESHMIGAGMTNSTSSYRLRNRMSPDSSVSMLNAFAVTNHVHEFAPVAGASLSSRISLIELPETVYDRSTFSNTSG